MRIKESAIFEPAGQAIGRIVLSHGTNNDYVTHYENLEGKPYLLAGHYFPTLDEALVDFDKRVKDQW